MARLRRRGALWLLVLSQVALSGGLAVCVALEPGVVLAANEGGVSNYGVRGATVVPYTLAFASCALFLWLAARAVPPALPARGRLAAGMEATAAAFAVVLASTYPYKLDRALDDLHLALAVLLFLIQLVFVTWLTLTAHPRWPQAAFWLLWSVGFVLGGTTIAGAVHLLFVAQAMMTIGFALVTVTVVARLLRQRQDGGEDRRPAQWRNGRRVPGGAVAPPVGAP